MSGLPQPTRQPSLRLVIDNAVLGTLLDVHTGLPGKVVSWDPTLQLMDVKPLVQRMASDPNGDVTVTPLPIITSVPFTFPGNGNFGATWPVSVGDFVWLKFAEAAIDGYMQTGMDSVPVDASRFALNGCVAEPGPRPRVAPLPLPEAAAYFIGRHGALTDFVALAAKVEANLNALKTAITSAPIVPGDGGASFKAALIAALNLPPPLGPWPLSVGSTTVKASQ